MGVLSKFPAGIFVSILLTLAAHAEDRVARMYDVGHTSDAPVYIQKIHSEQQSGGVRLHKATIVDAHGKLVVAETATLINNKVVSQHIDNFQLNVSYQLEVKDGQAIFQTYKLVEGARGPLQKEKVRRAPASYIFGPNTEGFLQDNAETLKKDGKLESKFGVFQAADFFGMRIKKVDGPKNDTSVHLEMRPSSFFLSTFLVDPIELEVDPTNFHLIKYKGRTALLREINGKMKPWNAEIVYSTEEGAP